MSLVKSGVVSRHSMHDMGNLLPHLNWRVAMSVNSPCRRGNEKKHRKVHRASSAYVIWCASAKINMRRPITSQNSLVTNTRVEKPHDFGPELGRMNPTQCVEQRGSFLYQRFTNLPYTPTFLSLRPTPNTISIITG